MGTIWYEYFLAPGKKKKPCNYFWSSWNNKICGKMLYKHYNSSFYWCTTHFTPWIKISILCGTRWLLVRILCFISPPIVGDQNKRSDCSPDQPDGLASEIRGLSISVVLQVFGQLYPRFEKPRALKARWVLSCHTSPG